MDRILVRNRGFSSPGILPRSREVKLRRGTVTHYQTIARLKANLQGRKVGEVPGISLSATPYDAGNSVANALECVERSPFVSRRDQEVQIIRIDR